MRLTWRKCNRLVSSPKVRCHGMEWLIWILRRAKISVFKHITGMRLRSNILGIRKSSNNKQSRRPISFYAYVENSDVSTFQTTRFHLTLKEKSRCLTCTIAQLFAVEHTNCNVKGLRRLSRLLSGYYVNSLAMKAMNGNGLSAIFGKKRSLICTPQKCNPFSFEIK